MPRWPAVAYRSAIRRRDYRTRTGHSPAAADRLTQRASPIAATYKHAESVDIPFLLLNTPKPLKTNLQFR
ncbi:Uncharacterised protein [Streptococcus pneumoniae]|nr:Uncharacterised protein [Streptococcus pneumoniae]